MKPANQTVDLSAAFASLRSAEYLMGRINNLPTNLPISVASTDGDYQLREIEHTMCKITADLRLAMAHVEQERLRVFGWPLAYERVVNEDVSRWWLRQGSDSGKETTRY